MLVTLDTTLVAKRELAKDVYLLTFTAAEPTEFTFEAGQYVILLVPQPTGPVARRLFSIASSTKSPTSFELLVKYLPEGIASQFFKELHIGGKATFQGPAGIFTLRPLERDIIILATGTGFAPIRSMLDHIYRQSTGIVPHVRLYWGFPTFHDAYLLDELHDLSQTHPTFTFSICLSRETSIDHIPLNFQQYIRLGRITAIWEEDMKIVGGDHTSLVNSYDYYLCGGRTIVDELRQYMQAHEVAKERIHFEKF